MSRLAQFSARFTRSLLAPQNMEPQVFLLTIDQTSGPFADAPLRVCNQPLQRLDETPAEIVYGCVSRGEEFVYFPFSPNIPGDEHGSDAQVSFTLPGPQDAVLPFIRALQDAPRVLIEIVLASQLDTVEASWPGMHMGAVRYGRNGTSFDLSYATDAIEPFPRHTFTPRHFPALFSR